MSHPKGKSRLAAVVRASGDVVSVGSTAKTLRVAPDKAAKLLAGWSKQGWLQRVGSGLYVPVSLELLGTEQTVSDAWMLAPALFAPCYVGGRTAAEHWDLTEQIFRDIVVFTAKNIRARTKETGGALFTLKRVPEPHIFGTKTVWRGRTKVSVSDLDRTILDMLDDPATSGGIQHVTDCLDRYLSRDDNDTARLIEYAEHLGNRAVFKRLGFLAERHAKGAAVADLCATRLSAGYAKLDPSLDCPRIVAKWKLRIPENWKEQRP